MNQSGEPQEICHQIDFDECYMHYVTTIKRQSICHYYQETIESVKPLLLSQAQFEVLNIRSFPLPDIIVFSIE